jgi:hypothetical protein
MESDESEILDFGKVLEKDLANIIKKAAAGAPLNKRERDLIEAERTKREKKPPPPPEKKKSGRASNTGYSRSYNFYAEQYSASARTVKRWVKTGKDHTPDPIPCPLDDPTSMRSWWGSCMSQTCPDGILAAEVAALKTEARAPSNQAGQAPEVPDSIPVVEIGTEEKGLAAAMKRLEQMEVEFSKKATEPGQAKTWFDAIARMTSLAANVRKELEAQNLLAPRAQVAQELRDLLQPVETGIRGMYSTLCESLEIPATPALEAKWLKACDKLFERFGKEIFTDV